MYAKRIQTALIPSLELFSDKLEHFVLYKPLAIVSGDFYWVSDRREIFRLLLLPTVPVMAFPVHS